jgi:predicted RNA-binding Zn ribbon-like protein
MTKARGSVAPGALRLPQEFLNTLDRECGEDELSTPAALLEWLGERGLLDDVAGAAGNPRSLKRTVELREALRELIASHSGAPVSQQALKIVNRVAAKARLRPVLTATGRVLLEPEAHGIDGALGLLVAAVNTAIAEGTWARLKVCDRESCRWAFYDRSKNGAGRWCAMAGSCGGREKNRRAYRRRKAKVNAR